MKKLLAGVALLALGAGFVWLWNDGHGAARARNANPATTANTQQTSTAKHDQDEGLEASTAAAVNGPALAVPSPMESQVRAEVRSTTQGEVAHENDLVVVAVDQTGAACEGINLRIDHPRQQGSAKRLSAWKFTHSGDPRHPEPRPRALRDRRTRRAREPIARARCATASSGRTRARSNARRRTSEVCPPRRLATATSQASQRMTDFPGNQPIMWCERQFAAFNNNLKLDPTRQGRIVSAVDRVVAFSKGEEQLKLARAADPFFQGSVATRTVIRPLASDEFDVDVVFPFKLSVFEPKHQNPTSIFNWFVARLQTSEDYRKRMEKKNRCVRLDYAGDFHVDLIPATVDHPQHQPYAVPARDLSDWITNDPAGFTGWVNTLDAQSGLVDSAGDGVFRRCVRYMKRWRDHYFGEEGFAPSVLLVTILGKHEASNPNRYNPPLASPLYPTYKTDAAYLYDMLRLTVSCIGQPNHGAFMHPTIQGEDLAVGWSQADLDLFVRLLTTCRTNIVDGITATTESAAVENFRKAFGDTFPA